MRNIGSHVGEEARRFKPWYNAARGGHAPGHLRDALVEALEITWEDRPWWELLEICFFDPAKQSWWDAATAVQRATWLLGQLWNCTDIAPHDICTDAYLQRRTYAALARKLKSDLVSAQRFSVLDES
jgi:hypothetical protein